MLSTACKRFGSTDAQMLSKHKVFGKDDIMILSSDPIPIGYTDSTISDNAIGSNKQNQGKPNGHVQKPAHTLASRTQLLNIFGK